MPAVERHPPDAVPSEIWRRLSLEAVACDSPPRGLDAAWNAATGRLASLRRRPDRYLTEAASAVEQSDQYAQLAGDRLRDAMDRVRERIRLGREDRADLLEASGLIRENAARILGIRPHLEQVAAALAIHDGCIAEMATGEGKTLAVGLAGVMAGWRGRGCHVMTFNDYLAARDAQTMEPLYRACGLRVAHIEGATHPEQRRAAYQADVTYCTKNDVAADFLRDRLTLGRRTRLASTMLAGLIEGDRHGTGQLLLRGLDTAIIDEADSILIDEAVTPLIISGNAPNVQQVEAYENAATLARELQPGLHYTVDERRASVRLTREGDDMLERFATLLRGVWAARRRGEELLVQALTAREFFLRDRQYVIQDSQIIIVDESTGRLMPDRTWQGGLHQAMEAKEGLTINEPKETQARISFQRFFRMYRHLAGTTGTGWEARRELWQVYGLTTVVLPTHQPCRRRLEPDRLFFDAEAKWTGVLQEIERVHRRQRPILIGTRNVETSERLSRRLAEAGLEHQVLNATRQAEEAQIVARAGQRGRITVATNMAGRGTDIKLGPGVAELGGLHVIASERHENSRIDRQLFGRAARQGDPGSAVAFVSLDDDLCERHTAPRVRRLAARHRSKKTARAIITAAQRRAERAAARQRRWVLGTDDWLDRYLGFTGRAA